MTPRATAACCIDGGAVSDVDPCYLTTKNKVTNPFPNVKTQSKNRQDTGTDVCKGKILYDKGKGFWYQLINTTFVEQSSLCGEGGSW